MTALTLCLTVALAATPVATKVVQVAPPREAGPFQRSKDRARAVVLIHGFKPQPFSDEHVRRPEFHRWQVPGSTLVTALGKDADVYSFGYGQNVPIAQVTRAPALASLVAQLKELGYGEIVLLGHSAGGIVAREFVEDHPRAGVTKVIQVCTPNMGTALAKAAFGLRKCQAPLVESLTPQARAQALRDRTDRKIPAHIEFVCVVCQLCLEGTATAKIADAIEVDLTATTNGDGVVCTDSQWSDDLRKQGIPAVGLPFFHNAVVYSQAGIDKIAELVRDKQPRWSPEKVAEQKPRILNGTK
jgi:pimeloyl-ACP methyl ester carboxylesterase